MNPTGKTGRHREETITQPGVVATDDGPIPYTTIIGDGCVIAAPVRVRILPNIPGKAKRVVPERNGTGRLVYALPGGGALAS